MNTAPTRWLSIYQALIYLFFCFPLFCTPNGKATPKAPNVVLGGGLASWPLTPFLESHRPGVCPDKKNVPPEDPPHPPPLLEPWALRMGVVSVISTDKKVWQCRLIDIIKRRLFLADWFRPQILPFYVAPVRWLLSSCSNRSLTLPSPPRIFSLLFHACRDPELQPFRLTVREKMRTTHAGSGSHFVLVCLNISLLLDVKAELKGWANGTHVEEDAVMTMELRSGMVAKQRFVEQGMEINRIARDQKW